MKTRRQTDLPRFIVGALAAAGASTASGATVQITFNNGLVNQTTGFIALDLTGDGISDITGIGNNYGAALLTNVIFSYQPAIARSYTTLFVARAGGILNFGSEGVVSHGLANFSFQDARINGNMVTAGFLDVSAFSGPAGMSVQIHRLVFDDTSAAAPSGVVAGGAAYSGWEPVSAVPEASSSLALLALGAGGLLTRRRQKRAA